MYVFPYFFLRLRGYRDFLIIIVISSYSWWSVLLMFLDINIWRCQIGIFNGKLIFTTTLKKSLVNFYSHLFNKKNFLLLILSILQLNATYTSGIYFLVTGSFSIDLLFLLSLHHFLVAKLLLRCGDVGILVLEANTVCQFVTIM